MILTLVFLIFLMKQENHTNSHSTARTEKLTNSSSIFKEQQFLKVEEFSSLNRVPIRTLYFDLKNERLYSTKDDGIALGPPDIAEGVHGNYKKTYKSIFNNMFSIFKRINVSNKMIENSDFVLALEMKNLITSKDRKMEFPDLIQAYALSKNAKLERIKIVYNRNFLPVRIDGYFNGEMTKGWRKIEVFSYNVSEKKFNEDFNYLKKAIPESELDDLKNDTD